MNAPRAPYAMNFMLIGDDGRVVAATRAASPSSSSSSSQSPSSQSPSSSAPAWSPPASASSPSPSPSSSPSSSPAPAAFAPPASRPPPPWSSSSGPAPESPSSADAQRDALRALLPPIGERDGAAIEAAVAAALASERSVAVHHCDAEVDGAVRSMRVAIAAVDAAPVRAVVHVEDLTDTLRRERAGAASEHAATLSSFATTIAHKVRNPLGGISAAVQLVAATFEQHDGRRDALARVLDEAHRIGALCGDLLEFTQNVTPWSRDFDLREAITAGRHAFLSVEGEGRAHGDPALAERVFTRIIENAREAGCTRVVASVADGYVCFADDGGGIPADVAARVFEPFFTTKLHGTGLGLTIARRVLHAMGGSLELCSSPLGGCGLLLRLPHAKT